MLTFANALDHPHLVHLRGDWECDEAIYVVEEYVVRGDLLSDSMSHPERYTEQFTAKVCLPECGAQVRRRREKESRLPTDAFNW